MNYSITKNIEHLLQTLKNHLARVKIQQVTKKQMSTAAICTATSPPAATQKCSCPCTLLHTCCSTAHHIHCPLPHARWLPAIHCRAPVHRRLRIQQRMLLAATPTPPLLHTAACMPLAPLLLSPLPPLPLLVPHPLIAKKRCWLAPSVTVPSNARFNPELLIVVIVVHCNFSTIPPSFLPLPLPPPPILIVPPAGRCHYCLPLQS